jgi:phasin family protein
MFTIPEQFSTATKSNIEAQLALMTNLTNTAFAGVEKFVGFNLTVAKAQLEESTVTGKQLLAAKDAQEFFALTAQQAQPNADKAIAYTRQIASIATSTQAEFTKAAEAQVSEASRKVLSLVDEVTKNAPAGSETAVAMFKSGLGNASAAYEQLTKTTKQAVETIEANLQAATSQFVQATEKASTRAKK